MSTTIETLGTIIPGSGYDDGFYENVTLSLHPTSTATPTSYPVANITVSNGSVSNVQLIYGGSGVKRSAVYTANLPGGSGFKIASNSTIISVIKRMVYLTIDDKKIPQISRGNKVIEDRTLVEKIDYCNSILKPMYDSLNPAYEYVILPSSLSMARDLLHLV